VNAAFSALVTKWRDRSAELEPYATGPAAAFRHAADELEATLREWELTELTLEDAAAESGFSYSALQKQVASGKLVNVGTKHRPRVRRADLPRKVRRSEEPDLAGEILRRRAS
jgi:hypothetical protein